MKKLLSKIRCWFCHTTVFWIRANVDSFAIFDKALSVNEILNLYTAAGITKANADIINKVVKDNTWHHFVIVFKRFGRQKLYLDGNYFKNTDTRTIKRS